MYLMHKNDIVAQFTLYKDRPSEFTAIIRPELMPVGLRGDKDMATLNLLPSHCSRSIPIGRLGRENIGVKYLTSETEPCRRKRNNINRAIADDGWYAFTRMLTYKDEWNGGKVVKAAKDFPSSERCSRCGHIEPKVKDIRIRRWICPKCGTSHDRDVNAVVNLKNEGIRLMKMM